MAGESSAVRVDGLDEAIAALRALPARLRKRALRNALAAGGRVIRDVARRGAPVINPAAAPVLKGWRKPGTLKRAIVVRTSKAARRAGDLGVFVNVRPAKAGQRGAKNPLDPFYWRFVEFGTRHSRPQPFLRPAAAQLQSALRAFEASLGPQVRKLNAKGATA